MKRKIVLFLVLCLFAPVYVFGDEPVKINDMESYIARLIELNSTGENNSWQVLDSLSVQMSEGSPVFKAIMKEAENKNDRARYLIGRFYLSKGKNDEAIKWLGKVTSDRFRNARFMLATALMNKAKRTSNEAYYLGASEILNKLKKVRVEDLANTEAIDFLLKACEKGTVERKIFTDQDKK